MAARRKTVMQAASDVMGAYLQQQLGTDVRVSSSWPEPDQPLHKSVTLTSVGARRTEYHHGEQAKVIASAELSPPDPVLKSWTFLVANYRQGVQLDVWATSFVQCDDLLARLTEALSAGPGVTLGLPNADPFRDGTLLAMNPDDGFVGFTEYVFDDESDDQTPAQVGRDEWRATLHGECAANLTITKVLPRLKQVKLKLTIHDSAPTGDSELITFNDDGSITIATVVP